MRFARIRVLTPIALGVLLLAGCPPVRRPIGVPPPVTLPPPPIEPALVEHTALIYKVHPKGDPLAIIRTLNTHPSLRLTLVFPAQYFDPPARKEALPKFRDLQASGQIEVALTLENEPMLPLLGNLKLATSAMSRPWDVTYAWPDDIEGQIARGSGAHQKQWARLPAGFYPPHQALSDQVMRAAQKFRMSWVLSEPQPSISTTYVGTTALLIPAKQPAWGTHAEGTTEWGVQIASWAVSAPYSFVDSSAWDNPASEPAYLDQLGRLLERMGGRVETNLADQSPRYLSGIKFQPPVNDPYAHDYSLWVQTLQQRAAWSALADARRVYERYKTSGRASIARLDAAAEELYTAQSGPFLLALGQSVVPLPINQRNFTATLANVYRHSGSPVPANLNRLFVYKAMQRGGETASSKVDEHFFESGDKRMAWNDPTGDDHGPGSFRYPTGKIPKGAFDLKQFSIRWTEDHVVFTISVAGELLNEKIHPILPLADVYIDVNRIMGAGSTDPLRGRGAVTIEKEAAWEYALAFSPATAVLYQALPGRDPRKMRVYSPTADFGARSFSVRIPIGDLRGTPSDWRLSVALGGMEQTRAGADPTPIAVLTLPSDNAFGGAAQGRTAPRYIDFLAPSQEDQTNRMKAYEKGLTVTLPFVEAMQ